MQVKISRRWFWLLSVHLQILYTAFWRQPAIFHETKSLNKEAQDHWAALSISVGVSRQLLLTFASSNLPPRLFIDIINDVCFQQYNSPRIILRVGASEFNQMLQTSLCEYLTFRNLFYCPGNYSHQMKKLLPPAYVARREVMFSQLCVCSGRGGALPHLHPTILPTTGTMSLRGVPRDWSQVPSEGLPQWLVSGPFLNWFQVPSWGYPLARTGVPPAPSQDWETPPAIQDWGTPLARTGVPPPPTRPYERLCLDRLRSRRTFLLLLFFRFVLNRSLNQTCSLPVNCTSFVTTSHKRLDFGIIYKLYNIYESRRHACLPIMRVLTLPHHNCPLIVCWLVKMKQLFNIKYHIYWM